MKNYDQYISEVKWYKNGKFEEDEDFDTEEELDEFDPALGVGNLVGKTLIDIDQRIDRIIFIANNGQRYMMYHDQNCCECVEVDDVVGDINDLIGSKIFKATEDTNNENPRHDEYGFPDSFTWTFYNISTVKGHVTIRWYGFSNGYYSESVDFVEVDENGGLISDRHWRYK
jgi:hypothetical protein